MRCAAPDCHQDRFNLRSDGLCFAHGKERDGLLELRCTPMGGRPRAPDRMPAPWKGRQDRWPRLGA